MLRVHLEHGRYPSTVRRWFPVEEPDPFFEETVLTAMYGGCWTSTVIEEGGHALRHAFAVCAIGNTGLFDIEPLEGYAGPLTTLDAPADFLIEALRRYSTFCREHGIVGELMRFNPILRNHLVLEGLSTDLVLLASKPVVYLPVHADDPARMSAYPRATRNMVRAGHRHSRLSTLEKAPDVWAQFRLLFDRSLEATGTPPQWQLSPDLSERLRRDPHFVLVGAVQEERVVSAAIALLHPSTSYYFRAAGVRDADTRRGASNAVVHEIARAAAAAGAARVGLGGGRTASLTDSLFRFKRSVGRDVLPFSIGLFTHDRAALAALVRTAEQGDASIRASALFLRYRLAPAFADGRMRPVPVRPLAARGGSLA